ncbi:MAG TPA: ThiF family adenylyltransferase [Planctomycetota bacterium]
MADLLCLQPRESLAVTMIGLGGVGGIAARHLAVFLASLECPTRLVLVDGDRFEPHNRTRMMFGREGNKAEVVRDELRERHAGTGLAVLAVPEYVGPANVERLIENGDHVVLAVDNHATRKVVSDRCRALADVVLVSGGNDGVGVDRDGKYRLGTYGTVQAFVRHSGRDQTPSLCRWHPEIAEPADTVPEPDRGCLAAATSRPQLLFANLQVASSVCSTLFLQLCGNLPYAEVAFDIAAGRMRPM